MEISVLLGEESIAVLGIVKKQISNGNNVCMERWVRCGEFYLASTDIIKIEVM